MRYKRNAHFRTTLAQSLLKSSKLRNVFTLSLVAPKTLTRVLPNNLCPFHQPSISCHAALYTVEELYTHGRQRVPHKVRAKTRHEQSCLLLSLSLSFNLRKLGNRLPDDHCYKSQDDKVQKQELRHHLALEFFQVHPSFSSVFPRRINLNQSQQIIST